MADRPTFTLELSQWKYLSTSDSLMDAVLTVTSTGGQVTGETAEVLLIDCSSSMDWPPDKITAARRATAAAIDTLRDGTLFAVVEGTEVATMAYPTHPKLVRVNAETRAEAKKVAARLLPSGGTAMGTWLALADSLFDAHPDAVHHAVLLTDGRNESEPAGHLDQVLEQCEGKFVCDARGIGDHWEPDDLSRIAAMLRGTADAVVEDSELAADFERMIEGAMAKVVPDLRLRITTLPFTRLRFVKQVHPTEIDLTDRGVAVGERTLEFGTGSWGEESRDYHVCLEVTLEGKEMAEDLLFGRIELVSGTEDVRTPDEPALILGYVTEDAVLSSRIDEKVERYTVQHELGSAVRAGWDAFVKGDRDTAAVRWGHAVRLATQLGNETMLKRLWPLVDVLDAENGLVRVKDHIRPRDGFSAVHGSVFSEYGSARSTGHVVGASTTGTDRRCATCGWVSPPGSMVCVQCGNPFAVAAR
jgi:Ca-activated chloride channel family protein